MHYIRLFLKFPLLPFAFILFLLKYLSCISKSKKYMKDPEIYSPEFRFKKISSLISLYLFIKDIRVKFINKNQDFSSFKQPCLFVGNHKSNADALVFIKVFSKTFKKSEPPKLVSFVAKKEIKNKSVGKLLYLMDCVFIDRDNIRQAIEAINQQSELLKRNVSICIFPEGTRIMKDQIMDFHAGSLKVGLRNLVPIVPFAIYGSMGIIDKEKKVPKDFSFFKRKKRVLIELGQPINSLKFATSNTEIVASCIKSDVESLYNHLKSIY